MSIVAWDVMVATCPSRTSLARIANKWTAMIVIALSRGQLRFGELRQAVDGISGKVRTDTLRDLERDGIVRCTAYAEMPPRVEYSSPRGRRSGAARRPDRRRRSPGPTTSPDPTGS
jgi:DNA-binding HxlR family transcriptional regulator